MLALVNNSIVYNFKVNGIILSVVPDSQSLVFGGANLGAYVSQKAVNIDSNDTYGELNITDITCNISEGTISNLDVYNFNMPFYMSITVEADVYNN